MESKLKVLGMSCQGCVRSVTNVLTGVPGVTKAEVSLEKGEACVDYDAERVSVDALRQAIIDAGFEAS